MNGQWLDRLRPGAFSDLAAEPFAPNILQYDQAWYPFASEVAHILGTNSLESIGAGSHTELFQPKREQGTIYHNLFYEAFPHSITEHFYLEFIQNVIRPLFGGRVIYQKVPTLRVHLPGNVAVGEFHTDAEYGHQEGEVNFWVPLTRTSGHDSIWIESRPGSRCYEAVSAGPGDILVFDSVRYRHGNQTNTGDRTRVSFDFRCIAPDLYKPTGAKTVYTGKALEIGDYFDDI